MKRIEVKLALPIVAPLLDLIKGVGDSLGDRLAAPQQLEQFDAELRQHWRDELVGEQNAEVRELLGLFDSQFFATGVIVFDAANAEAILRACAALRLRLRELHLKRFDDDLLESGAVEFDSLEETTRKAFMCYIFLATIQELIIEHLDSSILDG